METVRLLVDETINNFNETSVEIESAYADLVADYDVFTQNDLTNMTQEKLKKLIIDKIVEVSKDE